MPNTKCPRNIESIPEKGRGERRVVVVVFALLYKTISIGLRFGSFGISPVRNSRLPTSPSLHSSLRALFANSFLMRSAQFSLTFANSCHKREQNNKK